MYIKSTRRQLVQKREGYQERVPHARRWGSLQYLSRVGVVSFEGYLASGERAETAAVLVSIQVSAFKNQQ